RRARGGAPIKLRIVKGANLAMERIEAAVHGWPQAPYETKPEVDANYKRMLEYGCRPEHAEAVHLGIASHNLFDIAYGLVLREARSVEPWVEFEMLEGMANHQARAVQARAGGLLLYAPVVRGWQERPPAEIPLQIGGELRPGARKGEGLDPSRPGHPAYRFALAGRDDVDRALTAALHAQPAWAALTVDARGARLEACAVELERGRGDQIGRGLVTDARVGGVVLTGSVETARLFLSWRPDLTLFAETSGKNAIVVTALADRDQAIRDLVRSAFGHNGQKCSAASLAICEAEVYDDPDFRRQLRDAAASLAVVSAWETSSRVTPLTQPPGAALR